MIVHIIPYENVNRGCTAIVSLNVCNSNTTGPRLNTLGPRLNITTVFPFYGDSNVKDDTVGETVLSLKLESLCWQGGIFLLKRPPGCQTIRRTHIRDSIHIYDSIIYHALFFKLLTIHVLMATSHIAWGAQFICSFNYCIINISSALRWCTSCYSHCTWTYFKAHQYVCISFVLKYDSVFQQ